MTTPEPTPAPLTPDQVTAIRGRAAAATRGPWEARGGNVEAYFPEYNEWGAVCSPLEADATFIAHARADVPALLDAHDALTTALAEARAEVAAWKRVHAEDQEIAQARRDETRIAAVETALDAFGGCPRGHDDSEPGCGCLYCTVRAALTQPQGDR